MKVTQIHFHFGYGYLTRDLPQFEEALANAAWFVDRCPDVDTLDVGGGLGAPITPEHPPLDLGRWAALIARATRSRNLKVHLEPGDYLMKDAGALLCEINTVENKGGVNFAGVDAGLNLQNLWAYYQTPFVVAPLALRTAERECETYTVTGNINEAIDVLAEDVVLPRLQEGDFIALLNAAATARLPRPTTACAAASPSTCSTETRDVQRSALHPGNPRIMNQAVRVVRALIEESAHYFSTLSGPVLVEVRAGLEVARPSDRSTRSSGRG